jgi:hypothetical protein
MHPEGIWKSDSLTGNIILSWFQVAGINRCGHLAHENPDRIQNGRNVSKVIQHTLA